MRLRQWLEHQRNRVRELTAPRRAGDPDGRTLRSGDIAGITEVLLQQAETERLLRDFRERKRYLLIEHQGALARALGRDLLENPHLYESDDWRAWQAGWYQENDSRAHTRPHLPVKSRQHSNAMER